PRHHRGPRDHARSAQSKHGATSSLSENGGPRDSGCRRSSSRRPRRTATPFLRSPEQPPDVLDRVVFLDTGADQIPGNAGLAQYVFVGVNDDQSRVLLVKAHSGWLHDGSPLPTPALHGCTPHSCSETYSRRDCGRKELPPTEWSMRRVRRSVVFPGVLIRGLAHDASPLFEIGAR